MADFTFGSVTSEQNISRIKDTFSKYVVTPAASFGVAGFVFDVPDETVETLQAEITDHFVEDNSAVQDHIALRPVTLEMGGFVGELVYEDEAVNASTTQSVVQKLTGVSSFLPNIASSARIIKNAIQNPSEVSFENATSQIADLYGVIKNANPSATRQQQAYLYFKALFEQRVLFGVQTPFGFLNDMAIESITAVQGKESNQVASFSVTMKQIRKVTVETVAFSPRTLQRIASQQKSEIINKGKALGKNASLVVDFVKGIFN